MQEIKADLTDRRAQALARLAVLQRLKDHAVAGDRASMFRSIDQLMEAERQALGALPAVETQAQS